MNDATAAQSEGAIDTGASAFGKFFGNVMRNFVPPMFIPRSSWAPSTVQCGPYGC
jgi:hypothetical protein